MYDAAVAGCAVNGMRHASVWIICLSLASDQRNERLQKYSRQPNPSKCIMREAQNFQATTATAAAKAQDLKKKAVQ